MMSNGFYAMHNFGWHMGVGRGICMLIGFILIGLIVYGVMALTRKKQPNQTTPNSIAPPDISSGMNILNERYARGEMDDEEYARRKAELRK